MRYAAIREMDISNGEGIGAALFIQGCHFHCPNCFNPETWDFNGGKEWDEGVQDKFFELVDRPHIKRISILGGEPLADENVFHTVSIIEGLRHRFDMSGSTKKIWLYTGYTWPFGKVGQQDTIYDYSRLLATIGCNVLVDGKYEHELRDYRYKWAGSTNQRVIDVKATIKNNFEPVLWKGGES